MLNVGDKPEPVGADNFAPVGPVGDLGDPVEIEEVDGCAKDDESEIGEDQPRSSRFDWKGTARYSKNLVSQTRSAGSFLISGLRTSKQGGSIEPEYGGRYEGILVTKFGRLKMITDCSGRDLHWDHSAPSTQAIPPDTEEANALLALETLSDFAFDVQFQKMEGTDEYGFDLDRRTLLLTRVSPMLQATTPMEVGDRLVAFESQRCSTYEDYCRKVAGKVTFGLTFVPPENDVEKATDVNDDVVAIEIDKSELSVWETSAKVSVPIRRTGCANCRLEWGWKLNNRTVVKSSWDQIDKEGKIVFEPGEMNASIEVDIPRDPTWNVEGAYQLDLDPEPLEAPKGIKTCVGDNYRLAIYSLNLVTFPAGIFGGMFPTDRKEAGVTKIIIGFLEHNYTEMRCETIWGILLAMIPAVLHYFSQNVFELLVNCGLNGEACTVWGNDDMKFKSGRGLLWGIAAAMIFIEMMQHVVALSFRTLRLGGKAKLKLRSNIFSTMLQLTEASKEYFDDGDIAKILDTECETSINMVWTQAFSLCGSLFGLVVKLALTIQVVSGLPVQTALVLLCSLPYMIGCCIIILGLNMDRQFKLNMSALSCEENWAAFVAMCESCDGPILSYRRGWRFTMLFSQIHSIFNRKAYRASASSDFALWMLKHSFVLVVALIVILGGTAAQQGKLSVGGFLVLMRAVEGFGKDLHAVGRTLNTMVIGSASIGKIARVLNSETRRYARCLEAERRQGCAEAPVDSEIRVERIVYNYPTSQSENPAVPLLSMRIPAECVVYCPCNAGWNGKENVLPGIQTLFKLFAGELLPLSGHIFIPERWRCIYVPIVPVLFDGTLLYNLRFSDRTQDSSQVWGVCKALGMSTELLGQDDFDVGSNGCFLKFSDRVIVSLTRALLHDVDFLLVSSALDVLGESRAVKVLRFLRRYTQRQGLPNDRRPLIVRHRKTVLYTSKFPVLQKQATHVITTPKI